MQNIKETILVVFSVLFLMAFTGLAKAPDNRQAADYAQEVQSRQTVVRWYTKKQGIKGYDVYPKLISWMP